jgi:hypothetical protein
MIENGLEPNGFFNFTYDFAKHGGAISTITVGPKLIPPQTIIVQCSIRTVTALVGTNATVAMHLLSSEDVLAATAITSMTLDDVLVGVPVPQTASTWIVTTAHTQLSVVIATTALTAGKLDISFIGHRSQTT